MERGGAAKVYEGCVHGGEVRGCGCVQEVRGREGGEGEKLVKREWGGRAEKVFTRNRGFTRGGEVALLV